MEALTRRVAENNLFDVVRAGNNDAQITELRRRIKHIIYVIKENRTYDQILGDLEVGDGDPALTEFPEPLTPNLIIHWRGISSRSLVLLDSGRGKRCRLELDDRRQDHRLHGENRSAGICRPGVHIRLGGNQPQH